MESLELPQLGCASRLTLGRENYLNLSEISQSDYNGIQQPMFFFFKYSFSEHVSPWSQMLGIAGIDYDEDENLKASGASVRQQPDATRIRSTGSSSFWANYNDLTVLPHDNHG